MTASTAPGSSQPPLQTGIAAEARRLVGSLTQHFQSLFALAGLEGREALALYVRMGIAVGAALFFAAFGYIFLLLFVAFAIAHLFQVDWLWISLGLFVLHLLAAIAAGLYVKTKARTPIFRGTAEEIRKDAAALRSGSAPSMS